MARAIIHNPMLIVADEPTGNLDYENGVKVMELLTKLNKEEKKTVIMVTHDLEYLSYAKTAVQIFDGKVLGVFRGKDKYKIETQIKQRKQYVASEDKSINGKTSKESQAEKTEVTKDDQRNIVASEEPVAEEKETKKFSIFGNTKYPRRSILLRSNKKQDTESTNKKTKK